MGVPTALWRRDRVRLGDEFLRWRRAWIGADRSGDELTLEAFVGVLTQHSESLVELIGDGGCWAVGVGKRCTAEQLNNNGFNKIARKETENTESASAALFR